MAANTRRSLHRDNLTFTQRSKLGIERDLLASMEWAIESGFAAHWSDAQWTRYTLLLSRLSTHDSGDE